MASVQLSMHRRPSLLHFDLGSYASYTGRKNSSLQSSRVEQELSRHSRRQYEGQ